jgi:tryptophanyl-tRNA synthetase
MLLDTFATERAKFDALMADPQKIDAILKTGAQKAAPIANATLSRVRKALGFN